MLWRDIKTEAEKMPDWKMDTAQNWISRANNKASCNFSAAKSICRSTKQKRSTIENSVQIKGRTRYGGKKKWKCSARAYQVAQELSVDRYVGSDVKEHPELPGSQ